VRPAEDYERKSVGSERTFRDEGDEERLREMLRGIAEELEGDLERAQTAGRCIALKVRPFLRVLCFFLFQAGYVDRLTGSISYILTRCLHDKRC
jgi:hypothetical protein